MTVKELMREMFDTSDDKISIIGTKEIMVNSHNYLYGIESIEVKPGLIELKIRTSE